MNIIGNNKHISNFYPVINSSSYMNSIGTITEIVINGTSKGINDMVNLGTTPVALPINVNTDIVDGYYIMVSNTPPTDANEHTIMIVAPLA